MLLKSLVHAVSPAGARGRLTILIFHRVLERPDPLFPEIDLARFNEILSWVARWFNVVPLDQGVADLFRGSLPARALSITFDDGYADNALNAVPLLNRHSMSATFFIATSFLNGGRMWNDTVIESIRCHAGDTLDLRPLDLGLDPLPTRTIEERRATVLTLLQAIKYLPEPERQDMVGRLRNICRAGALPDQLMMSTEQVRSLARKGMQVGAHTHSHPILGRTDDSIARREIHDSKSHLESILDAPVTLFAYPNGKPLVDYDARHVALVREAGFAAAFTTAAGSAGQRADRYQLPRFTPWDRRASLFGLRLARNGLADGQRCE